MSKQMVHRWYRQFTEGHRSVHDEERSGRLSLINVDLVRYRDCHQAPACCSKKFKELKTSVTCWFPSQAAEF
ncbi:hypothetical protein TNIN_420101 [Trichonephila inaurata madagascariensis]|uniref:Mos1 transposase HTH domain-containing protein n=1 Tax=Trichonephila inaurata madagascariensis TaxID=2747483 RepID=A0A8X6XM76_9ARAC|nr:hypothetical protein TNIN_420101 [Trichonephila inaurata madagascariensis]